MWIEIAGLCNLRDVAPMATASGEVVRPRRLLRSDNLQDLDADGIAALRALGLSDVIDLRSTFEVDHAPSPFASDGTVRYHHLSYFIEEDSDDELNERALPWLDQEFSATHDDPVVASYLSFVADRPDSLIAALRAIADAEGAALVHCAAGKDRTGITVALALSLAGVPDEDIAADYALTTERIPAIIDRMMRHPAYAQSNAASQPPEIINARPEVMTTFLRLLRQRAGSVEQALIDLGWTSAYTQRIRTRLLR